MAETQYTSTLTGPELDEALRDAAGVDAKVEQAQSAAQQAAQSASSAQGYASAASGSASQASTSAGQAAESAADASGRADAAAESARQAAASAASIEGDVEQASSSASAAAQSATQASGSASAAAQSASAAADSEDSVQQNAAAAQQAAAAASQSKSDAEAAASNAASSASTAQQAASLIEENLSAIQAAPSNAQAAQQAAAQAAASASAAEDAAGRAEQIADFDPADFATAAQGQKADSAVQQVNGKRGTSITLSAADVGAATAAQGALADSAVQPADLNGYAQTSDIPTELPNPQSLGIRLGSAGSLTAYDGSIARTITITPEAIGAATSAQGTKADTAVQSVNGVEPDSDGNVQIDAQTGQEPLIGTTDTLTPQQVKDAVLAGRLVVVTDVTDEGSGGSIVNWSVGSTFVQGLTAWNISNYTTSAGEVRLYELCGYFDNRGWEYHALMGKILPDVDTGDNGKTVTVQNGVWALASPAAGGDGKFDLLMDTNLTSCSEGQTFSLPSLKNYDAIGISVIPNANISTSHRSPLNIFPVPSGDSQLVMLQSSEYELETKFAEMENRLMLISETLIQVASQGYILNLHGGSPANNICVPRRIYGIKF